jgi:hypothetical protein
MILSGTLLLPNGQPFKDSYVKLIAKSTSEQVLKSVAAGFRTDEDGEYSVDCPLGNYSVVVSGSDGVQVIGSIVIDENTTETNINALILVGDVAASNPLVQQVREDAASALVSKNAAAASADLAASLLATKENTIAIGTTNQYWRGDKTFQTLDKSAVGLGSVDNTPDTSKPISTLQQVGFDLKTDKSVSLLSWAYTQSFRLVSSTRDSNGAIISASIIWPDDVAGVFTTDVASVTFPGAIDAWHATYLATTTKTITQPAVTRDVSGAVTAQPAIIIT